MQNIQESERLVYRALKSTDLAELTALLANREHLRFSQALTSPQDQHRYIQELSSQWQRFGYGCWLIIHKNSQAVVGWGGIIIDEQQPGWGPELIYYLAPEYCGYGYATELAQTAVDFALNKLKLDSVAAFAHPQNQASNKVLQKTGFIYQDYVVSLNRNHYLYRKSSTYE